MNLDAVDAILGRQLEAVRQRVERTGMDFAQLDELQLIRRVMAKLDRRFGSPELVRTLANLDSKRATLLLEMPDNSYAVLKVAGAREVGEAEVLTAWGRAGVSAVRPVDTGLVDGATYLLTEHRRGPTVGKVLLHRLRAEAAGAGSGAGQPVREDALRRTMREVVTVLKSAHLPRPLGMPLRPVTDRLLDPLRCSLRHLGEAGLRVPSELNGALSAMMAGHKTMLHGDPWVNNMLYDAGVVLIDPVACYGPAEYDAAQALCGVTPPERFDEMMQFATEVDPSLDPGTLLLCAGAYLTMEAGLNTKGQTHRAVSPDRPRAEILRDRGRDTLALASRLLRQGTALQRGAQSQMAM